MAVEGDHLIVDGPLLVAADGQGSGAILSATCKVGGGDSPAVVRAAVKLTLDPSNSAWVVTYSVVGQSFCSCGHAVASLVPPVPLLLSLAVS